MAKRGLTVSQTAVYNIRTRLRKDAETLARTHRGCSVARGCGCIVDLALGIVIDAERELWDLEIQSHADPKNARRIVNDDNTVTISATSVSLGVGYPAPGTSLPSESVQSFQIEQPAPVDAVPNPSDEPASPQRA